MIDHWDTRPYPARLADAVSQFFNVLLLNGMADETISGRTYRCSTLREQRGMPVKRRWRAARSVIEALFWPLDRGKHTERAFWLDVARAKLRVKACYSA